MLAKRAIGKRDGFPSKVLTLGREQSIQEMGFHPRCSVWEESNQQERWVSIHGAMYGKRAAINQQERWNSIQGASVCMSRKEKPEQSDGGSKVNTTHTNSSWGGKDWIAWTLSHERRLK